MDENNRSVSLYSINQAIAEEYKKIFRRLDEVHTTNKNCNLEVDGENIHPANYSILITPISLLLLSEEIPVSFEFFEYEKEYLLTLKQISKNEKEKKINILNQRLTSIVENTPMEFEMNKQNKAEKKIDENDKISEEKKEVEIEDKKIVCNDESKKKNQATAIHFNKNRRLVSIFSLSGMITCLFAFVYRIFNPLSRIHGILILFIFILTFLITIMFLTTETLKIKEKKC